MGKASTRAQNKYVAKAYDRLYPFVQKGRKAEIQSIADARGESLNDFIVKAIDERIEHMEANEIDIVIRTTELQKEFIRQAAEELGESVSEYLIKAGDQRIRRIKE